MIAADLISVSAIVIGFGVTAVMFRVQRELYVLEVLKN
jgi:multisubunit Na+/H+ antiporter MnhC subunit